MSESEDTTTTSAQTEDAADVAISEEAKAVMHRLDGQGARMDRAEREIQEVAEALLSQIADLEKQYQHAFLAMEAQSAQRMGALEARIEAAESARREAEKRVVDAEAQVVRERRQEDVYKQAWQSAPLTLRLKFVRELLPDSHALQNMLKEAAALEELRRRGHDLEAWLSNYPALFADAAQALLPTEKMRDMQALLPGEIGQASGLDGLETHSAEILATQTLKETWATLEITLQALGLTWISPVPGDPILAEHEVIGEETSSQSAGCVARVRRRGFRFQGRLALPAQVVRAAAASPARPAALPEASQAPDAPTLNAPSMLASPTTAPPREEVADEPTDDLPDWLRMLRQRTFGCALPAVSLLAEQVFALKELPAQIAARSEEEACRLLASALLPLLPLLGMRYEDGLPDIPAVWGAAFLEARPPLSAWLTARLELSLVAPARGEGFDARTMEALETRRTVHAKEDETVAKLERIGIVWRARPLFRAQVVRYTTGGNA